MTQNRFLELLQRTFGITDRFVVVRGLVRELLARLVLVGPPFEPRTVAQYFGIAVVDCNIPNNGFLTTGRQLNQHLRQFNEFVQADHEYDFPPESAVIVVRRLSVGDSTAFRRKQRFAIAHEFGHWYLRKRLEERAGAALRFPHDDPDEEMLCNLFAAEILVPTDLFVQDITTPTFDLTRLLVLTDRYDVNLATLLVKASAVSRHYAAFALFKQRSSSLEVRFSTPCRQLEIFFDGKLRSDVSEALESQEERRATYVLNVGGKRKRVEGRHVPIEDNRQVLSFVHDRPFEAKELASHATG